MTPDRVAAITEVPVDEIRRLADQFALSRPATICAGYGMQRYANSGQTMRALISLLALAVVARIRRRER